MSSETDPSRKVLLLGGGDESEHCWEIIRAAGHQLSTEDSPAVFIAHGRGKITDCVVVHHGDLEPLLNLAVVSHAERIFVTPPADGDLSHTSTEVARCLELLDASADGVVVCGRHSVQVRCTASLGEALSADERDAPARPTDAAADAAAVFSVTNACMLQGDKPVLFGYAWGGAGAAFSVKVGDTLRTVQSGERAKVRSLDPKMVSPTPIGENVSLCCEGAALPAGFHNGTVVSVGGPLPTGLAVGSRFRGVLVATVEDGVSRADGVCVGATLRVGVHLSSIVLHVERCVAGMDGAVPVWALHVRADRRVAVNVGALGPAPALSGVRLLSDAYPGSSTPAIGVFGFTAVLPEDGAQGAPVL